MYLLIFAQLFAYSCGILTRDSLMLQQLESFLPQPHFWTRNCFLQDLLNSFLSSLCTAAPLRGGGGVCTVTQAIFLYFATFFVLAPCRMPLDNGTCAKIEQIFGYLYFIFILLIKLVFSYRAWQGRGATSPLAWSLLGAILQLQKLILRICIRALWE